MRFVLIGLAGVWGLVAILAFLKTHDKTTDAKLTAGYFLFWPVLMFLTYINQPLPLWVSVPVFFGFIPWFLSGPHLWAVLQDPTASKPGEWVGIPSGYWKWGGIGAVLLGVLFNSLNQPLGLL